MMAIYLHGLGLQYFRGIGEEIQKIFPFRDFNFFIGGNNSGKSTILDFINRYLNCEPGVRSFVRSKQSVDQLDNYRGKRAGSSVMFVAIPVEDFTQKLVSPSFPQRQQFSSVVNKICTELSDGGAVWVRAPLGNGVVEYDKPIDHNTLLNIIDRQRWPHLQAQFLPYTGGDFARAATDLLSMFLSSQNFYYPESKLIPAVREIGPRDVTFSDFSGRGLINRLAEIQSPDHDRRHERIAFNKINKFLASVTGNDGAEIEIPHNREHVLVHMDNKVLPLKSLGTGIHEVIMIAAFCTLSEQKIICIEEPEIHLHPLLQRKLIRFLQQNTENQYFIATHSAAFIDTPGAAIFHVSNDGSQTRIKGTVLPSEKHSICIDLGYKASDIIQSNAIVWVEGPSDRIYIRHWISYIAPELVEGIHYSIMFYGGRLLSHLSANSDEVNEFIALHSLNRNLALVMDSDKRNAKDEINATKTRLAHEFSIGKGVAWLTQGREIENYIEYDVMQNILKSLYVSKYVKAAKNSLYTHALEFEVAAPEKKSGLEVFKCADKVRVAKLVCELPAKLDVLDLRQRIDDLVNMIRKANEI